MLVALIFGACQPITRPPAAEPRPPQGLRPDAPPYAVRGPYAVGVRDFVIDTPDRKIAVSVWYPALNPTAKPEAVTYALGFPTNPFPEFTIAGHALRDAVPDNETTSFGEIIKLCGLLSVTGTSRACGSVALKFGSLCA